MNKKEIIWLAGTVLLVLIINLTVFGIEGLKDNSTVDFNVHDTYFVIANIHVILLVAVSIIFLVYLIRVLSRRFRNLTANLILMISTILLILVSLGISSIIESLMEDTTGWTIYAPVGTEAASSESELANNNLTFLSQFLFYSQLALLIFLMYCGYRSNRSYQRISNRTEELGDK